MNGKQKESRMPDVSLSQQALDTIKEENTQIPESKMFKKKNNVNLNIVETLDDGTKVKYPAEAEQEPPKKPKKKLTEKQLEALKRGREKSIATRKAKAEALKVEKEMLKEAKKSQKKVKVQAPTEELEDMSAHATDVNMPQQQLYRQPPPPQHFQQQQLDYDRIIRGLADEQDKRSKARENREHQVAEDIKKYEEQIRADERARILAEVEREEQEELAQKRQQKTQSIFNPQIPVNAYSRTSYNYGSFGNGRSRRNW